MDKPFDIADLSSNKYAASMRELANGLGGWSGILLPFFYLYQIKTLENAYFFSWKTLVLVLGGELIFVLVWKLANIVLAFIAALLIAPVINSGRLVMAQNIQNTWMAIFGLLVCVASWFFASYTARYMFSESDNANLPAIQTPTQSDITKGASAKESTSTDVPDPEMQKWLYEGSIKDIRIDLDGNGTEDLVKEVWGGGVSDKPLTLQVFVSGQEISSLKNEFGIQPNYRIEDRDGDGKKEIIIWSGLWDPRLPGEDGVTNETYEGHSSPHRYIFVTYKLIRGRYDRWDFYTTKQRYEPFFYWVGGEFPK